MIMSILNTHQNALEGALEKVGFIIAIAASVILILGIKKVGLLFFFFLKKPI